MKNYRLLIVIALGLLIAACGGDGSPPATPTFNYTYSVPPQTNDGWATGHLEDHGFDLQRITEMIDAINSGQIRGIDSITIVRNNTLLMHAAYPRNLDRFDNWVGNTDPDQHVLHSTSKSFTAALIGIAIDQGYIASVDVPFYDLFSYASYLNADPRKTAMTLEDALNMRLGLLWDEWSQPYGTPGNDLEELMRNNTDYAKALLDLPVESDPGTTFTYNTAATIAIGQAIESWSTRGFGGQDIFSVPSLNLVVAFTGQNYESDELLPFSLMQDYILPSID